MLINNIDISNYKAKLLERVINVSDVDNSNVWISRRNIPSSESKYYYSIKKISLKFDIVASSSTELEECKSNITKALESATIRFDDIDINYTGYYSGTPSVDYIAKYNDTIAFTFYAYAWKNEKTVQFNKILNTSITAGGNTETPAIVEITPAIDLVDLTLTGLSESPIKINNLHSGKKIILNGEDCTVLEDGTGNKFRDTGMWEFPYLKVGTNNITASKNSCNITIKYKERFI